MENKVKRSGTERNLNKELILTDGEILLLWRRRKGWKQATAAKYYKLSLYNYKMAEYDNLKNFRLKDTNIYPLKLYERCLIYRKRSGKKQSEIAVLLNVGRYWIRLQETGKVPCAKLSAYWEGTL